MKKFYPKRPVRSFRDLEVYTKTLECSVEIRKLAGKKSFSFRDEMVSCAGSIPLSIAEAHSLRFFDRERAVSLLEEAMAGCNKMVVYLEEMRGIIKGIDYEASEELIGRYITVRGKIFRLEKAWRVWSGGKEAKNVV